MVDMSIDNFKNQVGDGIYRPNLFRVVGRIGTGAGAQEPTLEFLCKGVSIPSSTIGEIPLNYAGRILNVAGDKDFEPMNITVLMTEDYNIRSLFEVWSNQINAHRANAADPATNNLEYMANDWEIYPLKRDQTVAGGNIYKLHNVWPGNISPVEFSTGNENTAGEFTVEINYLYWTSIEGTPGQ